MTAGTFVIGTKLSAASAAGNAVLCRPRNSCCIVGITCHIAEFRAADNCGTSRCAVQERHTLCTGAGVFGIELSVAGAAGNSLFHRPCNCLSIVAVRRNIGEAAHALGLRRTGRTPQEGDGLRASADAIGVEGRCARAGGNVLLNRPDNRVLVISAGGNVGKRVLGCRSRRLEGCGNRNLAGRHGEGVLSVLLGQLDLLVLAVQNGEGIQHIALVGIDRQGDGGALGGGLVAGGHIAVLGALHGDAVSGIAAAAVAGMRRAGYYLDLLRGLHGYAACRVADSDLRVGSLQCAARAVGIAGSDVSCVIRVHCVYSHTGLVKALARNISGLFGGRCNLDPGQHLRLSVGRNCHVAVRLVAAIHGGNGDGGLAGFHCRDLAVFIHSRNAPISTCPHDGLIRRSFGQNGGSQRLALAYGQRQRILIQRHAFHLGARCRNFSGLL